MIFVEYLYNLKTLDEVQAGVLDQIEKIVNLYHEPINLKKSKDKEDLMITSEIGFYYFYD